MRLTSQTRYPCEAGIVHARRLAALTELAAIKGRRHDVRIQVGPLDSGGAHSIAVGVHGMNLRIVLGAPDQSAGGGGRKLVIVRNEETSCIPSGAQVCRRIDPRMSLQLDPNRLGESYAMQTTTSTVTGRLVLPLCAFVNDHLLMMARGTAHQARAWNARQTVVRCGTGVAHSAMPCALHARIWIAKGMRRCSTIQPHRRRLKRRSELVIGSLVVLAENALSSSCKRALGAWTLTLWNSERSVARLTKRAVPPVPFAYQVSAINDKYATLCARILYCAGIRK